LNDFLERLQTVARTRRYVQISEHGFDEMAEDALTAREVVSGFAEDEVVEEYPVFPKGPCVLVLQQDRMCRR
jgi:hypothetical protein